MAKPLAALDSADASRATRVLVTQVVGGTTDGTAGEQLEVEWGAVNSSWDIHLLDGAGRILAADVTNFSGDAAARTTFVFSVVDALLKRQGLVTDQTSHRVEKDGHELVARVHELA